MRRSYIAMLCIAGLSACADSSPTLARPGAARADAAFTSTQSQTIPVNVIQFSPCTGEPIVFTGDLHVVDHVTQTGNGQFHVTHHENPAGITGTGLITGDKYLGEGNINIHLNNLSPSVTESFQSTLRFIGPGPDNNFVLRQTHHLTINANGEVTSERDTFSIECR